MSKIPGFNRAYRIEVGKNIREARVEKDIKSSALMETFDLTPTQYFNIEAGKASLQRAKMVAEYLEIDHEKLERDLRKQMAFSDVADGEEITTVFIIGSKSYNVRGKVIPSINPYTGVKIVSLTYDDGLSKKHPEINRIAVHKSKIKSLC